jgi:hypothetical protein
MTLWNAAGWFLPLALLGGGAGAGSNQQPPPADAAATVSLVVSVEAMQGNNIPEVARQDVKVFEENEPVQVTGWTPLKQDQVGLELFIVIDDSIDSTIDLQLQDVRKFVSDQPATTAVGVGYIKGGAVDTAQDLTKDHDRAAKAIRPPVGAVSATLNPYEAIAEFINRWPAASQRREILLISDGINAFHGGPNDSSLDSAIASAQRGGIQIYCVVAPAAGHLGHSMRLNSLAELKLSELVDETGGELYAQAFSYQMDRLAQRLEHQYRVTFLVKPEKPGYKSIRLETQTANAELVSATKVYVPPGK